MRSNVTIHSPVEIALLDSTLNTPLKIADILDELKTRNNPALEVLIREAFKSMNKPIAKGQGINIQFYHVGSDAYVFLVQPQLTKDYLIMQIARGGGDTEQGNHVENDFDNLRELEKFKLGYLPRTYGTRGRISLCGLTELPVTFTEYLAGYACLDNTHFGMPSNFKLLGHSDEDVEFDLEQSIDIMKQIVKIVTYIFARTYDSKTNKGRLVTEVVPEAGDFVYKVDSKKGQPSVKMVAVRQLDDALPRELLFYLNAPIGVYVMTDEGLMPRYFMAIGDKNHDATMLEGVRIGLREVFGCKADKMLAAWVDDYNKNIKRDLTRIFSGIADGNIRSYDDVPAGYRTMLRCFAVRSYLQQEEERTNCCRAPTAEDYAKSFSALGKIRECIVDKVTDSMLINTRR